MPASTARSTASHIGSSRYGCSTGAPSDRLITRIPYSAWWSIAQSIAAITLLAVPVPVVAVAAGEILGVQHALLQRVVQLVDARIDHRHHDAVARQRRHALGPGPHLVGAGALRRHFRDGGLDPDVARQMVDAFVLPQRVE